MVLLFILLSTLFIINNRFNIFKLNNSNYNRTFNNKRVVLWNNKDIMINNINLSLSYIEFMGYNFRLSITKNKDKSNKFYVSFRKINLDKNCIFDFKNIKESTKAFNDYESALSYFYDLKKDISFKLNNDKKFSKFAEQNLVYID